jgi:hypothetical protein
LKTLIKVAGIACTFFGIIFIVVVVYALVGGTGVAFTVNERVVTPQEFSIYAIVLLFVGIALTYIGFPNALRGISPHAQWRCLECYNSQESRVLKPKGWVKKKSKDGNSLVFCSQKCKEEWFGGSVELVPNEFRLDWKRQMPLVILLLLSIVSCFLPWLGAKVIIDGVDMSTTNYGFEYIIPLGAPYTTPVAILSVIGFALSAYSFKATERIKKLNVVAGILILIGAIAAFAYTSSAAIAEATGSYSYSMSVDVWAEYGMGLEVLFGFLMIIVGARTKPE